MVIFRQVAPEVFEHRDRHAGDDLADRQVPRVLARIAQQVFHPTVAVNHVALVVQNQERVVQPIHQLVIERPLIRLGTDRSIVFFGGGLGFFHRRGRRRNRREPRQGSFGRLRLRRGVFLGFRAQPEGRTPGNLRKRHWPGRLNGPCGAGRQTHRASARHRLQHGRPRRLNRLYSRDFRLRN